ncbi:MAG: hypothetical protein ACTSPQ_15495, partial [Candidatus Helarchaeota archaeon]
MISKKSTIPILTILLTICLVTPVFAAPTDYLLKDGDIPGWYLYKENTMSVSWTTGNMSMAWQIWINAPSWVNATKAVCLMVVEFPDDISSAIWTTLKNLFNSSANVVKIPGLEDAYIWNEGNLYVGIGYNGKVFLVAVGYNETVAPGNPFGAFWRTKSPSETSADEGDILTILTAQGSAFLSQIPGFEYLYVMYSVIII